MAGVQAEGVGHETLSSHGLGAYGLVGKGSYRGRTNHRATPRARSVMADSGASGAGGRSDMEEEGRSEQVSTARGDLS